MARKTLHPEKKARSAGISLPPDLIEKAKKRAFQNGMSLSGLVRSLLLKEIAESK